MKASKTPKKEAPKIERRGGARPNSGPKKARLPQDLLDLIGPAPDPLDLQEWFTRSIAAVQWEVLQGRPFGPLLEQLQRSAKVAAAMIPEAIKAKAARLLKRAEDERERDASAAPADEPVPAREDGAPRNRPLRRAAP